MKDITKMTTREYIQYINSYEYVQDIERELGLIKQQIERESDASATMQPHPVAKVEKGSEPPF